jgi:hypothetical protein
MSWRVIKIYKPDFSTPFYMALVNWTQDSGTMKIFDSLSQAIKWARLNREQRIVGDRLIEVFARSGEPTR